MWWGQRVESEHALRSRGLRITRPRVAVLEVLCRGGHHDADAVRRRIQDSAGKVSVQAVYDVLAVLVENGLARRVEPAGLPTLYEQRAGDNHHHLVCRGCGRTEDVDCVVGAPPCITPVDDHDFTVEEAEVIFWGQCPDCTQRQTHHQQEARQ